MTDTSQDGPSLLLDTKLGEPPKITYCQASLGYTAESLEHFRKSKYISKFLLRKGTASPSSARTYSTHLYAFAFFIYNRHQKQDVDAFVDFLRQGGHDPYDILADFAAFLRESRTGKNANSANHVVQMVNTAKKCLRLNGVNINNEDFHDFVSLPRKVRRGKTPIDKLMISQLLTSCKDIQLATAIMFHAVLGPRPVEACSVRIMDLDLESDIPKVTFRAEYAKTRVERTRFLTKELVKQLKLWLKYKYRKHRAVINGRMITAHPEAKPNDLVFGIWHPGDSKQPKPENIYDNLREKLVVLVDTLGTGWENDNRRRKITFYSFRRFAKSTISDLGFTDFSEWWIGHIGSTYYNKPEKERVALFRKIEDYLTFLDIASLEAHAADAQSKVEQATAENQMLKQKVENLYKILYQQGIINKVE